MNFALPMAFAAVAAPVASSDHPPPAPSLCRDAVAGEFLASNAKLAGVKSLPSGLQYKIVKAAPEGASPKSGDVVKIDYEGSLPCGIVFDSTSRRGKPVLMRLSGLVGAWMEALPLMRIGEEWMIYAPPELGYGVAGKGPIPPNSALVFRIKLLGMLSAD